MADPGSCIQCTLSQENIITDTNFDTSPSTFTPPDTSSAPSILIEFCDRCRWYALFDATDDYLTSGILVDVSRLHRATWTSTELFLTFPAPTLGAVTIIPLNSEETAGRFRVWLTVEGEPGPVLVWDRKVEGKFPELKELKQRIRDRIQPGKSLGHSDHK